MYKISWDHEHNGILLNDTVRDKEEIMPPRPVFHEELNLLGFERYWTFSESDAPLLWAVGRGYYQNGRLIGEANGGNLYERPKLVIHDEVELTPINLELALERNQEALSICEDEAKDFTQWVYKTYRGKVDYFAVAFSGGKDSQVILDIVSQVLAPDEYLVIFTDTTMEIPFTYELIEETKDFFKNVYPELQFFTAYPPEDALKLWKQAGSPSRLHRWCCSVCKTAPFAKSIKNLFIQTEKNGQPKIVVFEGVRAEESARRSKYKRLTLNVKQMKQMNAEIILYWNVSEVFLHLFKRKIPLNKGYRYGLHRVGCSLCPFGSEWSENILREIAKEQTKQFIQIIEQQVLLGYQDHHNVEEYIYTGQWKKRAGGRGIFTDGSGIDIIQKDTEFKAILSNPKENFFEWIKTIGDILYKTSPNKIFGELTIYNKELFPFEIENIENNKKVFSIKTLGGNILSQNRIKKILYKTTYCIHCGACEVECPTGALQVIPKVKIETDRCIRCSKCVDFIEKGCIIAKSLSVTEGGRIMDKNKIATSKYQTFGMRREWLRGFLNNLETWFEKNTLGNRQVESMVAWLKDAELMDSQKHFTKTAFLLKNILKKNEKMVWEIIWVNFFYNVNLIRWYASKINWNTEFSTKQLISMIVDFDAQNQFETTKNAISSLFNLFKDDKSNIATPLGDDLKIGIIEKRGKDRYVKKIGTNEVDSMAIAYCLYRLAEAQKRYDFTVSEFYEDDFEGGPYKLFGISRERLEDYLRFIEEEKKQIVRVELAADLDNVFLREDLTSFDILQMIE